jgi:dolichol-phosphate mannosyltransferase
MQEHLTSGHSSKSREPDLSFAIPCYNEADVLRDTIIRLVQSFHAKNINLELVLVNNGSHDETGNIIDELIEEGLPVIKATVEVNQGYGNGVLKGLEYCRGKFVGFICADGQVEAEDAVEVYEIAARAKKPKLVKVRRRFRMDGLTRKLVSVVYNLTANIMFGGLGSIDLNGNPKIFPRAYLNCMNLQSRDWFLDAEVMIKAKRLGLEIFELNVMAQMREGGSSHVRPSTCSEFILNLLKYRLARGGVDLPDTVVARQTIANQGK